MTEPDLLPCPLCSDDSDEPRGGLPPTLHGCRTCLAGGDHDGEPCEVEPLWTEDARGPCVLCGAPLVVRATGSDEDDFAYAAEEAT